ncbi:MAG: damage-control phosphatase ARMT1 family protein [Nitrososphaerales archaeon]
MNDEFLPALLLTSDRGSFAYNTLKVRIPRILRDTIEANDFPPDVVRNLEALYTELTTGRIQPLRENAADVADWNRLSAPHLGRSWLGVPWYWAEAYFYRRLLEATGYFQPGPLHGIDPFATTKRREWAPDVAPAAVARLLANLDEGHDVQFEQLLHASLWGNRTDLSYMVAAHLGATTRPDQERENLLVDDSAAVLRHLFDREGGKVGIITDNAGTELLMDVALTDFLLRTDFASEVHLHLKPQPFYVSDAMIPDLAEGTDALIAAGGLAGRLGRRTDGHVVAGALKPKTHPFYCMPLFFHDMPADLRASLSELDLVIVKGDANYRRLVGDLYWPPTASFRELTAYFPAPLVALRTFKSEVAVGLAPGQAERAAAEDPQWLVNGKRGVIQARL